MNRIAHCFFFENENKKKGFEDRLWESKENEGLWGWMCVVMWFGLYFKDDQQNKDKFLISICDKKE
jgi:hypothetical protein